jgi:O-antigen ligase
LVSLMVVVGLLPTDDLDVSVVKIAIVAGGAVIGIYALALLLQGSSLPIHGSQQRFSIATTPDQTDPNQLAASLLLPLLLAVDLVIWGRGPWLPPRTWRLAGAGSCLVIVVAIVLTGSRGGVIATALGLILILLFAGRWYPEVRRSILRFLAGALLTVGLVGLVWFAVVTLAPQGRWADLPIAPLQRLTNSEEGSSGRTEIWTAGLQACRVYCGLGAGLGNFPVVFTDELATSGAGRNVGLYRPGHDLYLELAVETGVVGLALLGMGFAAEWMALRRAGTIAAALAAALVALLVVDAFESFIWFKYFWLLFMVVRLAEAASTRAQAPFRPLREVSSDLRHQPRLRDRTGVV